MPTPEDLFRQCVELAPDFCLRSEFHEGWGPAGEWGIIATWGARKSVSGPLGALSDLLSECLAHMHEEGFRRTSLPSRKPLGQREPMELLVEIERADAKRKALRKEARESIAAAEAALKKVRDAADPLWREAERLDALVESRLLALAKRYPNDAQKAGLGVVAMLCAKEADKWEIEDGNDLAILLAG